jgi:hypothetical protein
MIEFGTEEGIQMSYSGARSEFQSAKSKANDDAIRKLAEGLYKLTRAIEADIASIKSSIK